MSSSSVDTLSELFESIEISATALSAWNLRHPWGIAFPGASASILHAVTQGTARIEYADSTAFDLEPGDVILTNGHCGGAMMSRAGVPLVQLEQLWAERGFTRWAMQRAKPAFTTLNYGGRGPRTRIMGVMFDLAEPWRTNLLKKLPPHIHFKRSQSVLAPWLAAALKATSEENLREPMGYGPIARRIGELVFFSCIRSFLGGDHSREMPWFAALTDRRLAKVLTAIRTAPDRGWTLEMLAREAGMSRSAFASRFQQVLSVPPMKYLREMRMQLIAQELASGRLTVKEAARRTKYATPSAFSIAFKRKFGASPQSYALRSTAPT